MDLVLASWSSLLEAALDPIPVERRTVQHTRAPVASEKGPRSAHFRGGGQEPLFMLRKKGCRRRVCRTVR